MELEKNSCQEAVYIDVFGEEHPGRVRGMGFGVCPSKVKVLEEKMNFFIQHFGGQIPPNI